MTHNWRELPAILEFCEERQVPLRFNTVLRPVFVHHGFRAPTEIPHGRVGALGSRHARSGRALNADGESCSTAACFDLGADSTITRLRESQLAVTSRLVVAPG